VRDEATETAPTEDQCLLVGMLRIFRVCLKIFENDNTWEQYDKKQIQQIIESSFVFSTIWSLCISINTEFRRPFDVFYKKVCNGEIDGIAKLKNKILPPAMDRGTIYDYCYLPETNEWKSWIDFTNKDEIDQFPKNSKPNEIIVTTVDTIRYGYM
jgi:dynein heavy chain